MSHRASVKPVIIANSIVNDGEMILAKVSGGIDIADLMNWIEEDAHFVVHVEWGWRNETLQRNLFIQTHLSN